MLCWGRLWARRGQMRRILTRTATTNTSGKTRLERADQVVAAILGDGWAYALRTTKWTGRFQ